MRPRVNTKAYISKLNKEYNEMILEHELLGKKIDIAKKFAKNAKNLEKEISRINEELIKLTTKINNNRTKIKQLKNIILKKEPILNNIQINETKPKPIIKRFCKEIEWKSIKFGDGFIQVMFNSKYYRLNVQKSISSMNNILYYYDFHKTPKLQIEIDSTSTLKILNEEVLFYNIAFLKIICSNFGYIKLENFNFSKWKEYNKKYYKKNLPFAFHTESLKKLCEYSNQNLPIIPTAEIVINNSGNKVIHNSFLFILKHRVKDYHLVIWESIEDSKASYIFKIGNNLENNEYLQNIYSYVAGEDINKRSTLILNAELQKKLNFCTRIYHTDIKKWNTDIYNQLH